MLACHTEFITAPTAYIRPANSDGPAVPAIAVAASDVHQQLIAEMVEESMDCASDGWDGYGAKAIGADAFEVARRFVRALPAYFPKPRVVTDPDGWFAFEWNRGKRKSVVVAVDPAYRLHFSGLLGAAEMDGSEPFFGILPESVERLLQRLFRL